MVESPAQCQTLFDMTQYSSLEESVYEDSIAALREAFPEFREGRAEKSHNRVRLFMNRSGISPSVEARWESSATGESNVFWVTAYFGLNHPGLIVYSSGSADVKTAIESTKNRARAIKDQLSLLE